MVSKWVQVFLKRRIEVSGIRMDTVMLGPGVLAGSRTSAFTHGVPGMWPGFNFLCGVWMWPSHLKPSDVIPTTLLFLAQQALGKL